MTAAVRIGIAFAIASLLGCATPVEDGSPAGPESRSDASAVDVSTDGHAQETGADAGEAGADSLVDVVHEGGIDSGNDASDSAPNDTGPDVSDSGDDATDGAKDARPDGDPACVGVVCDTPPAPTCTDSMHRHVATAPGRCKGGNCYYPTHDEKCDYGCENGKCKPDPCQGVQCNTPPAPKCQDPTHLRVWSSSGTCSGGKCTYSYQDVVCSHGCYQDKCSQCTGDSDCASGQWCDNHMCKVCRDNAHCGSSCQNCTSLGQVCSSDGSKCVGCVTDSDCGSSGVWCNGGTCDTCNTDTHCGPQCSSCSGTTPHCDGSACVCTATSCGSYHQCVNGTCQSCTTDSACGANCTTCSGATPHCLVTGTTSQCVACRNDADCQSKQICDPKTHTCITDPCLPPTDACSNGKQDMDGCSNARVIGRPQAAAGYKHSSDLCFSRNRFDENGGCRDAGDDNAYRIYLRKGEKLYMKLEPGWACDDSFWWDNNAYLGVYEAAGSCGDKSCSKRIWCDTNHSKVETTFTAPHDGWFVLVVGGDNAAFDDSDEGEYDFTVKLTCNKPGCEC